MSAPTLDRLAYGDLLADVRTALGPSGRGEGRLGIGIETEIIPVREDGTRLPLECAEGEGASGRELLAAVAARLGGTEERTAKGAPLCRVPGHGCFSFEPGGQIEFSTDTFASVGRVWDASLAALRPLYEEAERRCVRLVSRGMDPAARVEDAPLQLDSPRYRTQRDHYRALGPWGERMMMLSAAIHVNLDLGGRAVRRWRAANRMAPSLTALFANSPCLEGAATGHRSSRAEQWRHLDSTRTGVFAADDDPAGEYLAFALGAYDFLGATDGNECVPFRGSWERGADRDAWRAHLTTLFPEVRPRGYLEIRSIDALPPRWLVVPLVVAVGCLYEPRALAEVEALLPAADVDALTRAGRDGMTDPIVRKQALDLFDVALAGAERLGGGVVEPEALERAVAFREALSSRGLDPGHEADTVDSF